MIVCENRALFESIWDRCKRTGTGTMVRIVKQTQFSDNLLFLYIFTVLLVRALMHEFARISQAIIHAAFKSKKLPDPSNNCIYNGNIYDPETN